MDSGYRGISSRFWPFLFINLIWISIFLFASSCNFTAPDENEDTESSLNETLIALSVQQTLSGEQSNHSAATIAAQQATIQAQMIQTTSQAQIPPAQVTIPIPEMTQAVVAGTLPAPQVNPPTGNLQEQMQNAQILLFEDAVANPTLSRYIKQTLDDMGLRYKDDGNAIGWLKNDLISGSPAGKPWDLVILAIEERGNVSGEYFDYLQDVLNGGSSVILEAWHLDAISEGKVGPILLKCGVQVYPYFSKRLDLTDVVLYPYSAASSHPIINQPNQGLSFSKSLNTWLYTGDLGSLMALTGQGDAFFLLGRSPKTEAKDGALASCLGGRLIIQTFSSHSFSYKTMYPLWENLITNSLKVRFGGG